MSALPLTTHAAISAGKDGDLAALGPAFGSFSPRSVGFPQRKWEHKSWPFVTGFWGSLMGLSQFHPVLVATMAFSPVSMTCYILTCVVISAVDLCSSLFFAHVFIAWGACSNQPASFCGAQFIRLFTQLMRCSQNKNLQYQFIESKAEWQSQSTFRLAGHKGCNTASSVAEVPLI